MGYGSCLLIFLSVLLTHSSSRASTLVLEGTVDGEIEITEERVFTVPPAGLKKLSFRFAGPMNYKTPALSQSFSKHAFSYEPKPDSVSSEKDGFGNTYTTVTWTNLRKDAVVRERYSVNLGIRLKDLRSTAPYPLSSEKIPSSERRFLESAGLAQSNDVKIRTLASRLVEGIGSEQAAVMAVLNWVVDNIRYKTPIPEYDALWTLNALQGNCQNFSHLSIALLRSLGIPARIVGGISLGKAWKVPLKDGSLMQTIGQGGHAWIEVWYPNLGWVPYDAQQSHLFVGPRHVKQTVGLDSMDINDSWRASPKLPPFRDDISAEFVRDRVEVALKETLPAPQSYIMTASAADIVLKEVAEERPPMLDDKASFGEFGNLEFPSLTDFYVSISDSGQKTFDKETAEYVTGEYTYAQAFTVKKPVRVDTVSLAMHKFGGRTGSLWIDVVEDAGGKPGMEGFRSLPLALDSVAYHPGYKWFDFAFSKAPADGPFLKPGRYWIILRRTKDAIVSWFYTPGNRYGRPDDARSTAAGIDWSNIMNLDFNFKVKGSFLPDWSLLREN